MVVMRQCKAQVIAQWVVLEVLSIYIVTFIVLMIAWIRGFIVFHMTSSLTHILLILAVVSLILHFMRGRHAETDLRIRN